jgi:murein L,D-transpeptidase YafK
MLTRYDLAPWDVHLTAAIRAQGFAHKVPAILKRRRKRGQAHVLVEYKIWRAAIIVGALVAGGSALATPKHLAPIPAATLAAMDAKGLAPAAPILMRAYKKEGELEVWKQAGDGRFVHLKTFPICRWSGQLGPKTGQGDRQVPEGFYAVTPAQLNPNSSYHLSFDIGYPNAYDRTRGGSGAFLMVHGACSSSGCFAMTDRGVSEIYALVREAFAGGQPAFQFQSYPFRMTAENLAKHRSDQHIAFWRQLKEGSDRFEASGEEPVVGLSFGRYAFAPSADPAKEASVKARRAQEDAAIAALSRKKPAVMTTYADGGMHKSFLAQMKRGTLRNVSQPQTLAEAGREVVIGGGEAKEQLAKTEAKTADAKPTVAKAAEAKTAQPPAKRGATKTAVVPASAPAPVPDRPLYQRLFDVFTPSPASASASGGRT